MSVVSELLGHLKSHGPSTVAELRKVSGSVSENSTATMLNSLRGRGLARKRSDGRWELGSDPAYVPPDDDEGAPESGHAARVQAAAAPKPAPTPVTSSGLMRPPAKPTTEVPMTRSPNPNLPDLDAVASKPRASEALPSPPRPGDVLAIVDGARQWVPVAAANLHGYVSPGALPEPVQKMLAEAERLETRAGKIRKLAQDYLDLDAGSL